jgi:Flp pilus assembly protein TadD
VELGFASGQPEKALQALQEEVRLQPASVEVRRLLAITAGRMNKPEIAIEHFQWIKQNMPASASVELALGLAQQQKGDLAVAIAQFENARRMEPNNPEILATLAYALQQMGKSAEAVPIYRQALQARPTSLVLMNNLAVALSESGGNLKEALQLAQSTTSKDSANPIYADALGLVYLKRKETGNAVQAFRSAVANDSTNVSYRIHLARALTENGNKASAKAELDGAMLRSPSPEERKEITELSQR